jgi:D-alanine-D-alanine ligase
MAAAFGLDAKVLVETAIEGREVDCGVLGNEEPEASPVGEVKVTGDFYDYQAKYLDDSARLEAPADLPAEKTAEVRQSAVRAFKAIEGAGFSRVDFFLEKTGRVVINEINTLPGFRPVSMFPLLWDKAGLGYSALISRLVDLALARWRGKEASHG